MSRLLNALPEIAAAAVFLIPIFLYLNKTRLHSAKTTLWSFFLSLYLCAVYAIAGLPNVLYIRFDPAFNYVPFRYMFSDPTTYLNILLFMPLGCLLPLLRRKFRSFPKTLLLGFLISAAIEFFQLFTRRATDINDLMTNTLGTVLGYLLGMLLLKLLPDLAAKEADRELRIVFLVTLLVMFFLQPFSASLLWRLLA